MKYTPKNQLKVAGKMSVKGSDEVGRKLALASIIAAILFGLAAVIGSVRWW